MQISIELQYLNTSIQISFALSEYDSSVFSVGTSPAHHQIHTIYFLSSCFRHFVFMRCSAGGVQCLQIFCSAVQHADRTLAVRVQCSKRVPATSLFCKILRQIHCISCKDVKYNKVDVSDL